MTACAVRDEVNFGLPAGGQLDLHTTLCIESRAARASIVIDDFDNDPVYRGHRTARIYKLGSYISVSIILPDGVTSRRSSAPPAHCTTAAGGARSDHAPRFARRAEKAPRAPCACPAPARARCCVAPSMCLCASKRAAHRARRRSLRYAAEPRATAFPDALLAIGTGFALSVVIGSTTIRRECKYKAFACRTDQDNGVPRIQSSTGFAGRRFYFRHCFARCRRRRPTLSILRTPRS
ncbi:hypothetical protein [Paraburkholderia sp. RAU2J]|uniref:hypothetical protein n=1 Tax=Paraburkholderia sp. RAU2J TaxID=1938810 RepID=UPI0011C420D2|nr:hypothetical protein [Paraburkholderia sp. RAU2J]